MKSVVALTVLVALTAATSARYQSAPHEFFLKDQDKKSSAETDAMYVVQGIRGTMLGFEHGLFKTKETTDMCLDDDTAAKMMKVLDVLFKLDLA